MSGLSSKRVGNGRGEEGLRCDWLSLGVPIGSCQNIRSPVFFFLSDACAVQNCILVCFVLGAGWMLGGCWLWCAAHRKSVVLEIAKDHLHFVSFPVPRVRRRRTTVEQGGSLATALAGKLGSVLCFAYMSVLGSCRGVSE